MKRCPGSGQILMLCWFPTADGYPGAVVCDTCSGGILVVKGSVHAATSVSGVESQAGRVRVHYVSTDGRTIRIAKSKGKKK